jgi:hypothetical protein
MQNGLVESLCRLMEKSPRATRRYATSWVDACCGQRLYWIGEHIPGVVSMLLLTTTSQGEFPEYFQGTYQTLVEIRNKLEKLSLTQAWSLRETDLYDFQRQLDKIDESRVDGNFLEADGSNAELYVQRVRFIRDFKLNLY